MSNNVKVVRVFIGSPGGLDDERKAAREVVQDINRCNSEHWGCHLELVGWEDTIPGYSRPQSRINQDLDKCEYFIGLLHNRWGSKPSSEAGGFSSGFEEEYYRAQQRIEDGYMKDIAMYFKHVDDAQKSDPGPSLKKVLSFRQKCIDERRFLFKDFETTLDFRDLVRNKLTEIGWKETFLLENASSNLADNEQPPQAEPAIQSIPPAGSRLFGRGAMEFVSDLVQRPPEWDSTSPHEVARFRLIASTLSRSGNDESYIGNHDANLLFSNREQFQFSDQEIRSLIDCGVVGFENQNVPLWRWISMSNSGESSFERVNVLAALGNKQEKKNAIRILQIADFSVPSLNEFDKKLILDSWLSDETDTPTFEAAISFLTSNGNLEDLEAIEEICKNSSPQRKGRIESAIVGIISRKSIELALDRIIKQELDNIDDSVAIRIFSKPKALTTERLSLCLSAKSDNIRLRAAVLLFYRNEICIDSAKTLLTDNNHDIRLIAVESLRRDGSALSDDIVKKVLTVEKHNNNKSIFGLSPSAESDTAYYDLYLINRLSELDLTDLRKRAREAGVFDEKEQFVIFSKFGTKTSDEMKVNISDGFTQHFDKSMEYFDDIKQTSPDIYDKIYKLSSFQRRKLSNYAIAALCALGRRDDLAVVRKAIDELEIDSNEHVLRFVAKFGDWSDIERVKRLNDYPLRQAAFLTFDKFNSAAAKAASILALGKNRIADMLALDLNRMVRRSIANQMPTKYFSELSDDVLLRELNRDDDEYRIIFAIKCARSLPKKRISKILDLYINRDEHRYYNSIHWLDLGASLPQKYVKTITGRELLQREIALS